MVHLLRVGNGFVLLISYISETPEHMAAQDVYLTQPPGASFTYSLDTKPHSTAWLNPFSNKSEEYSSYIVW